MGGLLNKVAVITGAGSGIGAAAVALFCSEGAKVVAADVSGQQAAVADRFAHQSIASQCDVSVASEVQAMLNLAISHYGRLDILINNAGIDGPSALTADYPEAAFDRVMAVNCKAYFSA